MKKLSEDRGAYSLLENAYPIVPRGTWEALHRYVDLIFEWNSKTNLSGAQTPWDFIHQHLADCMAAYYTVPKDSNYLDVGSGAGLPGLVWSILDKDRRYFLLDSSLKRCAFLRRVQSELGLGHVTVLSQRFESLKSVELPLSENYGPISIVSRGTSAPKNLLDLAISSELDWRAWYVFSNQKIHSEYLTLSPSLGVEVKSLFYSRNLDLPKEKDGILSCLRKTGK